MQGCVPRGLQPAFYFLVHLTASWGLWSILNFSFFSLLPPLQRIFPTIFSFAPTNRDRDRAAEITFREWCSIRSLVNPPGVRSPVPVASGRSELKGSSKFHRQMSQNAKCLDVPQICWNGNCSGCLTRGAETWVLAFLLALQTSGWGQAAHIDLHLNRFFFKASWDPHKCWTRERCHVDWEYSCPSSCSSSPLACEQTL